MCCNHDDDVADDDGDGDDDDDHHHHHNHDHLQSSSLPARPLTPSDNSAPIYGPTLLQLLVRMKCISSSSTSQSV